jgi:NAD(P)-dependent dehydrogenase (short-subunit alcohol dehydrogenase family)
MNRLKDKIVLITGAAGAIGKAVAEAASAEGARAITSDLPGRQGAHALDVTEELDWLRVISEIGRTHGRIDGLVNAAGVAALGNIEETDYATWRKVMAVNLDGTFLGCKHGLALLKQRGGAIVNLSSVAGLVGSTGDPLYSMTKGGVTLFTKSAALEFARKGYRIRVNSMHPGTTETDMGDQVLTMRARNLGTNDLEPARQQALTRIPIGRMGTVSDIAKGIVFLASDDAAFMTGAGLVVDGGTTAQ